MHAQSFDSRIRTYDPRFRKAVLYPTELCRKNAAGLQQPRVVKMPPHNPSCAATRMLFTVSINRVAFRRYGTSGCIVSRQTSALHSGLRRVSLIAQASDGCTSSGSDSRNRTYDPTALPLSYVGILVDEGGLEPPCSMPDLQSGAVAAVPLVQRLRQ